MFSALQYRTQRAKERALNAYALHCGRHYPSYSLYIGVLFTSYWRNYMNSGPIVVSSVPFTRTVVADGQYLSLVAAAGTPEAENRAAH